MKKIMTISMTLLALVATQAMAEGMGHHGGMHQMLTQADVNHDGSISRDEFSAFHKQMRNKHHKKGPYHE